MNNLADDILFAPILFAPIAAPSIASSIEIDVGSLLYADERPCYEVMRPVFLDAGDGQGTRFIRPNPGEVIFFDGVPNQALRPFNRPAMAAFWKFAQTLR